MVPPFLVRALVADVTRPSSSVPAQVVIDANVCYFVAYSNFAQQSAAGGRAPQAYQLRDYRTWQALALRSGCRFFAPVVTLGEFVRLIEYAELEALWLTDPATPLGSRFSPSECKKARYDYSSYLGMIRKTVLSDLAQLRATVQPLLPFPTPADAIDQSNAAWQSSAGDYADALMVANACSAGIPHILSDDVDLLTFDGITLYTANTTAIQSARTAGKLVP